MKCLGSLKLKKVLGRENNFSENIFKDINLPGVNVGGIVINNLRYAVDKALLSESLEDLVDEGSI